MWHVAQYGIIVLSLIVVVVGIISCSGSGPSGSSILSLPAQFEGISESSCYSNDFWSEAYLGAFEINIPEFGDFRITYKIEDKTFVLLLRLTDQALVTVALKPEEIASYLMLQKGAILQPDASGRIQALETFDDADFVVDEAFGDLVLIQDGESVLAKPTPTPTPTPTPLPTIPPRPSGPLTRIVAIGNSITYGKGSGMGGYPAMLEAQCWGNGYNVSVSNRGIPGERSPETVERFQNEIQGADIVLLLIGTNDLTAHGTCDGSSCNTVRNIASMLSDALAAGVKPFVSNIIAATSYGSYAWINNNLPSINTNIQDVAYQAGVRLVDNYRALLNHGGDGLYSDSLHPNDWGYEIMANEWYRAIKSSLKK